MKDLATLERPRASANLGPALIMEAACLRHTEIPHTSRLFSDFQYHFDRVSRFYASPSRRSRSLCRRGEADWIIRTDRRAELVAVLRARNGDSASLDLLARPETVAVVTGPAGGVVFRSGLYAFTRR